MCCFLRLKTLSANTNYSCSQPKPWQFLLVASRHLRSLHKDFMMAGNIPKGYFFAEKDLKLKAQMGEKKYMSENVPGSNGHSFSLANSAGVFPVSTQLELRSIIGILQENQLQFYFRLRQKNMNSQIQKKNQAEQTGDTHLRWSELIHAVTNMFSFKPTLFHWTCKWKETWNWTPASRKHRLPI